MKKLSKILQYKFSYNFKQFRFVATKINTNSILTIESKNLFRLINTI
jgi:hypothetical protein